MPGTDPTDATADGGAVPTIADPVAVIIDLQAFFCEAPYGYVDEVGEEAVAEAIEATNAFLERYRASGRTPILVRTHHDEASNSPVWARKFERRDRGMSARTGSDGAAFAGALDVAPTDLVLTKRRYDAFYGTPLGLYLSANDATAVLFGGVATHVCVESAMRSAFDRDYEPTLLADCTASASPADRAEAIERIDGTFGAIAESAAVELPPVDG